MQCVEVATWPGYLILPVQCSYMLPWSHQHFHPVLAVKLVGIMLRNRWWLTTCHTITCRIANGWCQTGRCDQSHKAWHGKPSGECQGPCGGSQEPYHCGQRPYCCGQQLWCHAWYMLCSLYIYIYWWIKTTNFHVVGRCARSTVTIPKSTKRWMLKIKNPKTISSWPKIVLLWLKNKKPWPTTMKPWPNTTMS